MNYLQLLKRSWTIFWNYKTLWVIGFILALVGAGSSSSFNGSNSGWRQSANEPMPRIQNAPPAFEEWNQEWQKFSDEFTPWFKTGVPQDVQNTILAVIIALACIFLAVSVISAIIRYTGETALIKMVDQYEGTGEKVGWRKGFAMGWSRSAFRLFLIDVLLYLPIIVGVLLMAGCVGIPVLLAVTSGNMNNLVGVVAAIGFAFLLAFAMFIVSVAVKFVQDIIRRVCVLDDLGVVDSIKRGFAIVRARFWNVLVMWLLLIGLYIGCAIAMIPIAIVLLIPSGLIGFGLGLVIYMAVQASTTMLVALLWAIGVGGLAFAILLGIPLCFFKGLRLTYFSTTWTLVYREFRAASLLAEGAAAKPVAG